MLPDLASFEHGLWAIEEGALRLVLAIEPQALNAYAGRPLLNAIKASVRDSVAIIPVEGILFRQNNFLNEFLGASTYLTIRRDLQAALDDPNVKAILLNIHSPGGEVQGTAELAQAIRDARDVKPIVAYAGDLAASAAYWIASAASKIVIGSSAALGSIGVLGGYTDTSVRDEKSGVKKVEFVSSQSPFKRTDIKTDDGRARIQARVDALADIFIDAIASNCGLPRDKVLSDFGKGDVLIGKAALTAGLADDMGSFESVLASLAGKEPVKRQAVISVARQPPATVIAPASIAPAPRRVEVSPERVRVLTIKALATGHEPLAAQAITEGWCVERFAAEARDEDTARFILDSAGISHH